MKEIREFRGSEMNKNLTPQSAALINTEPSELLRLQRNEPIASESVLFKIQMAHWKKKTSMSRILLRVS